MSSFILKFLLFLMIPVSAFTSSARAQYFGQNKVRYKKLDFKVLKTQHFDIYYYPEEASMATEIGRMAERWYARFSHIFNHELSSRQPVIMYASAPDFRSTTIIPEDLGESTGGVTEPLRRRIVMPLTGGLNETDHVLGHELVHAFQYDISVSDKYGSGLGQSGMERLPLWFIEGMAEYLSLGPVDPNTAMWMRDAVAKNKVPRIKDLWNPKYFPYRWGQSLWAFIEGTYGERAIREMQRSGGNSGSSNSAIKSVLGIRQDELSRRWQAALRRQYEPILESTTDPDHQGKLLVSRKQHGGGSELNVSPALSPDGKQMVFFSEKDLFSIDLYLADAQTGQIKRKLTKTALNAHLDSLQFINSAGAWSFDGKRFALGEIVDGRPQLAIYDVALGRTVERIKLPQMGEVYNPTWSPDGKQIAFSALINGMSDLFIVDVASKKLRRMTNDEFADLQPAWSPDGSTIVFATDRYSTQISSLSTGKLQLALLHVDTGAINPLAAFSSGNHINPQWSPDGQSVYFVSDRDGIPNIYRISRSDGRLYQLTNIQTGISGITHLSPTFSVAAKTGRLVYSAFVDHNYDIYSLDSEAALAGENPTSILLARQAASLPPMGANAQQLVSLITDPNIGVVSPRTFQVAKYKPRLSLDYLAPPSFGVGYSNFGGLVSGGTATSVICSTLAA
jgi:Tol biopolymer transport system component